MKHAALVLAFSSIGCGLTGPSGSLAGQWRANSGDRFTFIYLTLQQDGDEIFGTACESAAGMTFYSGVQVTGDFPRVEFTVPESQTRPCCTSIAGSRFSGRQDSSKDIVGTYRGRDIRFERTDATFCE